MNFIALLSVISSVYAFLSQEEKLVRDLCSSGNFQGVLVTDPRKVTFKGLRQCLRTKETSKDAEVARLIAVFPDALPTGSKLDKYATLMYKNNMFVSVRALLAGGRCAKLEQKTRDLLVKDKTLAVEALCASAGPIIPGSSGSIAAMTPGADPTKPIGKPIEGSLRDMDEHYVNKNVDILARITLEQAVELGQTNNACIGFTKAHFDVAGVLPTTVASLSIHCFRRIPPAAFEGFTRDMVKSITAWPFARRSQVGAIKPEVIVALPFDQLGIGSQTKENSDKHACFGITHSQLKAIKKNSKAAKLYRKRCIRSKAAGYASPSSAIVFMSLFAIILAII